MAFVNKQAKVRRIVDKHVSAIVYIVAILVIWAGTECAGLFSFLRPNARCLVDVVRLTFNKQDSHQLNIAIIYSSSYTYIYAHATPVLFYSIVPCEYCVGYWIP